MERGIRVTRGPRLPHRRVECSRTPHPQPKFQQLPHDFIDDKPNRDSMPLAIGVNTHGAHMLDESRRKPEGTCMPETQAGVLDRDLGRAAKPSKFPGSLTWWGGHRDRVPGKGPYTWCTIDVDPQK